MFDVRSVHASTCQTACVHVNHFFVLANKTFLRQLSLTFFPIGIMKQFLACYLEKSMWKIGKGAGGGTDNFVSECNPILLFPDVRDQACTEEIHKTQA